MRAKREEAQRASAEARARADAGADAHAEARAAEAEARAAEAEARAAEEARALALAQEHARDLMTCLRELGFRAVESRRAIEYCAALPEASLEQRVRAALAFLCPKRRSVAGGKAASG